MIDARSSITAQRVAMRRAAHQLFDNPKILEDPIALPILSAEAQGLVRAEARKARGVASASFRAFLVARSRVAEDELAAAIKRAATQYVILGAGLDTFAYRNPYPTPQLRVFEVDHPATQAWKRKRLEAGQIAIPDSLTFAPVNFETESLASGLTAVGFDRSQVTCFSWLGVTPYLTRPAMFSTLEFIVGCAKGSVVVFDYARPRNSVGFLSRLAFDAMARRVARAGEPFQLFFDTAELERELRGVGFTSVEDVGAEELNARYLQNRSDRLKMRGRVARIATART
ncbi:MAG: SAM-dependent methyltransferase [Candidatus Acidiferrales bacterium]